MSFIFYLSSVFNIREDSCIIREVHLYHCNVVLYEQFMLKCETIL